MQFETWGCAVTDNETRAPIFLWKTESLTGRPKLVHFGGWGLGVRIGGENMTCKQPFMPDKLILLRMGVTSKGSERAGLPYVPIVFEITGAKLWKSAGEIFLTAEHGLKFIGDVSGFFFEVSVSLACK